MSDIGQAGFCRRDLICLLSPRYRWACCSPGNTAQQMGWSKAVWKALNWWPGPRPLFRAVEHSSGLWDVPSVSVTHPICSSLGRRNFFHFRGRRLPDETSVALLRGVLSPVVCGQGSNGCLREGRGFSHDISPSDSASGRVWKLGLFAGEARAHCVPRAGHFDPSVSGRNPNSCLIISQVLMRIAKKDILCASG